MDFEQYMNPPVLDNIMEQIEAEILKKKKYKDAIVGFDSKENKLSVDVYWGKANYGVYTYDGSQFVVRKDNCVENNSNIEDYVDKEDQRICKILESNLYWVRKFYLSKKD